MRQCPRPPKHRRNRTGRPPSRPSPARTTHGRGASGWSRRTWCGMPPATDLALRSPDWLARREALGNRYGDIAVEAVEMAAQFINEREPDKAQKSLISAGIATDKAQLLRGAATNRSEKV